LPVQHALLKLFKTMGKLDVGLSDDDEENYLNPNLSPPEADSLSLFMFCILSLG
jgi:hypothetical protein